MSSRVWFILLVWLSVCRWNAVNRASFVPIRLNNVDQKLLVNLLSWSETIILGMLCSQKMWSKKSCAVPGAVAIVWVRMKCAILESMSTTTNMASKPTAVRGSWTMKSIDTFSHLSEGIARGCRSLADHLLLGLMHWQTLHMVMNHLTSLNITGK